MDPSFLIFPSASRSISTTLTTLKRTNLSITNRLHSIFADAQFVERLAECHNLPLVANERCGSWYIPSDRKQGSAYFKSTDGHFGQWAFSLRRLNLQVLDLIGEKEGCIIVDSTRRGKSMPDALSKTVPIWICVLNRLLFPENSTAGELQTPEDVVSRSEHAQIEQRISTFVREAVTLQLDLCALRSKLRDKPMLPVWVTPDSENSAGSTCSPDINTIVLCTASGRTETSGSLGSSYVQGAADDSESWALGLDAASFWAHSERLLSLSEDELPGTIEEILEISRVENRDGIAKKPTLVAPTKTISIGSNVAAELYCQDFDVVISCSERPSDAIEMKLGQHYVHLSCGNGKVGSRQLRTQLSKLRAIPVSLRPETKVLVTCPTGRDLAVGVALAVICQCCTDDGTMQPSLISCTPNKTMIKHRLSWIMVSIPEAAPSRATLQSVNAFVID